LHRQQTKKDKKNVDFAPLEKFLRTPMTEAAQTNLIKVFIHKSFLKKRYHAPLWLQWKAVTHERHAPKFCHAWKHPYYARYLVDNCQVLQSGFHGQCATSGFHGQWMCNM